MNTVILSGRLTKAPEVRWHQNNDGTSLCIARYRLAVDHRKGQERSAYFFDVVALGRTGEFVQRYLTKGMKIIVEGELQSSTFTRKDGSNGYAVEVLARNHEFAESRQDGQAAQAVVPEPMPEFVTIPDDVSDENLPFN